MIYFSAKQATVELSPMLTQARGPRAAGSRSERNRVYHLYFLWQSVNGRLGLLGQEDLVYDVLVLLLVVPADVRVQAQFDLKPLPAPGKVIYRRVRLERLA